MSSATITSIRFQFLKCSQPPINLKTLVLKCSASMLSPTLVRHRSYMRRRTNLPRPWWVPKNIKFFDDKVTSENREFLKELEQIPPEKSTPLKEEPWTRNQWGPESVRTGVIARKIGIYPQWFRNGKRIQTTLLQVLDNHVIKYHSPEIFAKTIPGAIHKGQYGAVIVGANAGRPQNFTKAYCGIFQDAGVIPKKKLTRFLVTEDAKLQPGTPLSAKHFRVGDYVDVVGKTVGHGFQGVMKRWGMKGGPASHGSTKFHRRMGSLGGGAGEAKVIKGKKMPGRMGQERRRLKGLKVLRINYKDNVIWVKGPCVPGHVHHYVYLYDSQLHQHRTNREVRESLPFPTHYPEDDELPDENFSSDIFPMHDQTIEFAEDEKTDIKKKVKKR